jgi:hypothetical protein
MHMRRRARTQSNKGMEADGRFRHPRHTAKALGRESSAPRPAAHPQVVKPKQQPPPSMRLIGRIS